ncbi:MAG: histone deacetylase family protein [Planctomycetes bacterium]|nr:histone deacetylase family protein [Planctomycetota bacterium]NOG54277.1 histone deacetylase family protein [Planctomycetota bacterium]
MSIETTVPLAVFHDQRADLHDTGPGHPERPERLPAVVSAARAYCRHLHHPSQTGWDSQIRVLEAVRAVHAASYIDRLQHSCAAHKNYIDVPDSAICPDSFEAAVASAACGLAAAEAVAVTKSARHAFVAMRPPGHHCEHNRSMGFCLFNNVAVAACRLLTTPGIERVAIVDFDVHHGNGTQHLFDARDDVLYISTHQHPATMYPGTGYGHETGTPGTAGAGHTLNIPLDPGTGEAEALVAYAGPITERLDAYRPHILLVSAGFDADRRDPLANLRWDSSTFERITRLLTEVADRHCEGRIVSFLEGGYDLHALAEGVTAHLGVLAEG